MKGQPLTNEIMDLSTISIQRVVTGTRDKHIRLGKLDKLLAALGV